MQDLVVADVTAVAQISPYYPPPDPMFTFVWATKKELKTWAFLGSLRLLLSLESTHAAVTYQSLPIDDK